MPRMKKPHIVKKWARPGIDQRSSRVCPNTSLICVVMRVPRSSLRPCSSLVFWPDRIRFVSHSTRLAANTSTTAVIQSPTTSLISVCVSTACLPVPSYSRVTYLMLLAGNLSLDACS